MCGCLSTAAIETLKLLIKSLKCVNHHFNQILERSLRGPHGLSYRLIPFSRERCQLRRRRHECVECVECARS